MEVISSKIYPGVFRDRPCTMIEGQLTTYAIDNETHQVFDTKEDKAISIVQVDTGKHIVDSLLSLKMLLLNDLQMSKHVLTLRNKTYYKQFA
jgi:hypothetical protein